MDTKWTSNLTYYYKINNLKEINGKNCTYYYLDDIIKVEDFDFDNISLDEKSFENILIYEISYKTLIGAKPLRISFDEVDGFISQKTGITDIFSHILIYEISYKTLIGAKPLRISFDEVDGSISQKTGITDIFLIIMQESKLIRMIYGPKRNVNFA